MNESADRAAEWMAVLDQIEQALHQSLSQVPEVPEITDHSTNDSGPLEQRERLLRWQACLQQIEQQSSQAEKDLDDDQSALGNWLRTAVQMRITLAERLQPHLPPVREE